MLDHVSIFSKRGVVLWSKSWAKLKPVRGEDPVHVLVKDVLLEDKGGASRSATLDNYILRWTMVNELELVIVVVYQRLLQLLYIDDLLEGVKRRLLDNFSSEARAVQGAAFPLPFDDHFDRCFKQASKQAAKKADKASPSPRRKPPASPIRGGGSEEDDEKEDEQDEDDDEHNEAPSLEEAGKTARAKLKQRMGSKGKGGKKGKGKLGEASAGEGAEVEGGRSENDAKSKKKVKQATVWRDGISSKKISKKEAEALDRSKKPNGASTEDLVLKEYQDKYLPEQGEVADWEKEDAPLLDEEDEDEELQEEGRVGVQGEVGDAGSGGWFGRTAMGSFLQSMTGNKTLVDEDLQPVLESMRQQLIGKNVASEIAEDICASVKNSLVGQRLASFTRVRSAVVEALKQSVLRILTPRKSTDVLHEILSNKQSGEPYSIVFVGINGVGKSTSLSKVAYYLKENGVKVMIAACDTFRSGAVEQLRSHARCLDMPLFERGYMKDPGEVARAAIAEAKATEHDCVLVDTAGRMQNNDKLMKELAKLVQLNSPNLVLFVGEALVGNDGIDQLMMFNQALAKYLPRGGHEIDGIVLTKFDTIDDKVGATLSMSYKTGQPVMFVGTGQKYTHLKKLNVNSVIRALFN